MKKLLIEVFLLCFGGTIFIIFGIFGVLYTFFKHIWKLDYSLSRQLSPIIRSMTLLLDGFANAAAGEFLNDYLKVSQIEIIRYGKWYQTISAITGLRLLIIQKDTRFRKILDKLLGKDHCQKAISKEDLFYYQDFLNK